MKCQVVGILGKVGKYTFLHNLNTLNPKNLFTKLDSDSSSTMRFIHINEYEYMNDYVQYIISHTHRHIRIF